MRRFGRAIDISRPRPAAAICAAYKVPSEYGGIQSMCNSMFKDDSTKFDRMFENAIPADARRGFPLKGCVAGGLLPAVFSLPFVEALRLQQLPTQAKPKPLRQLTCPPHVHPPRVRGGVQRGRHDRQYALERWAVERQVLHQVGPFHQPACGREQPDHRGKGRHGAPPGLALAALQCILYLECMAVPVLYCSSLPRHWRWATSGRAAPG